ncbi:hypothetical protein BDR07DRAFT_842582 [Suillus spraguei]|nr:hypothetical protein BDR07DRAFT_842582 [Suillus spraguei]
MLWTIISSFVLTLFACTYTAIHTNISNLEASPYHNLRRQLGIMMMVLITPELIVAWAIRQWLSARQITREFKKLGYPNIGPEAGSDSELPSAFGNSASHNLLHTSLVEEQDVEAPKQLFLRRFPRALARWAKRSIKACFSKHSEDYTWTEMHSFFVLMGGFMLYVDRKPYLTLRSDYILLLIRKKCIDVPDLTAEQIRDKSKGNAISKGLIILQVAWFVMQLITRVIYHLEITQLEVGTLAFAVLNFLTYAVWWNKPLNVRRPHPVYWKSTESRPEDYIEIDENNEFASWGYLAPLVGPCLELMGLPGIPTSRKLQVPTFDGSIESSDKLIPLCPGMFVATIFGAIHCMAWSFAFPSYQERVLWRIGTIAITSAPFIGVFVWFVWSPSYVQKPPHRFKILTYIIYIIYIALYTTARGILLVLMFTTLRRLPLDAYKAVSWTSLVPHL